MKKLRCTFHWDSTFNNLSCSLTAWLQRLFFFFLLLIKKRKELIYEQCAQLYLTWVKSVSLTANMHDAVSCVEFKNIFSFRLLSLVVLWQVNNHLSKCIKMLRVNYCQFRTLTRCRFKRTVREFWQHLKWLLYASRVKFEIIKTKFFYSCKKVLRTLFLN